MLLAETNKLRGLLHLSFIGHVQLQEIEKSRNEVALLLADLAPGFRLLTDLSHLQSMDIACEAEIAHTMELCAQKGLGSVVRVIPEPKKDIGFNILTALHYGHQVRISTCVSLEEAVRLIAAGASELRT